MALLCMYGVDTGLKTEVFYELSKLVQELAGFKVAPNRPIVGDMLYYIESGIVTMFHRRLPRDRAARVQSRSCLKWWGVRESTLLWAREADWRTSKSTWRPQSEGDSGAEQ